MDFISYPKNPSPKLKLSTMESSFSKSNSQKNLPVSSSLAAFKSSLNKNPTYFSIGKSPEILNENKKLKEENWKLRQQVASLSEEVLKLKTRISHKYDPGKILMSEGVQIINQNKYIEVLQDSLRNLRNELKKSKKEIVELRKRINSSQEVLDMQSLIQTKKKLNLTNYENKGLLSELAEKSTGEMNELNRTITYLRSEIKILQEEKTNVESELAEYKGADQYRESRKLRENRKKDFLHISFQESFSLPYSIPDLEFTTKSSDHLFVPEKLLKRPGARDPESLKSRFLKSLFTELSHSQVPHELLFSSISSLPELSLPSFMQVLTSLSIKLHESEIQEFFSQFSSQSNQPKLSPSSFLEILQSYLIEIDSSRSSDISSRCSSPGLDAKSKRMLKVSMIGTIFDNIALNVRDLEITREDFKKFAEEQLPSQINFRELMNFFNKKVEFIQDPNDATIIVVNFLEGYEVKTREEIVQRSVQEFFKFHDEVKIDFEVIVRIADRMKKKENGLIEKMQAIDYYKTEIMSWEVVCQFLIVEECIFEEEFHDFELYCYLMEKSLKKIPYKQLLPYLESAKKNVVKKIKKKRKAKRKE